MISTTVKTGRIIRRITDEQIREEAEIKTYPETILTVKTEKTISGFSQEDITEIKRNIEKLSRELNEKILELFKRKSEEKNFILTEIVEKNAENYDERTALFDKEMNIMQIRFDLLKRKEQRMHDLMEHQIVYKEEKARRRLVFNIMKDYAHQSREIRFVGFKM
jgi:hypothetical protein